MDSFVATDLEGTLTTAEGWKSIRHYFTAHGRTGHFQGFFLTQMPRIAVNRLGWLDTAAMRTRWMDDMASLYRGQTPGGLAAVGAWIAENDFWPQRRPAVHAEIMRRHAEGARVVLVSGLYQPLLEAVASSLHPERVEALGTPLEFRDGRATGRCAGPVWAGQVKAQRVRDHIGAGQLTAAYGDTGPDAYMLELSREAVAVCPDETLSRLARERGWRVLDEASEG